MRVVISVALTANMLTVQISSMRKSQKARMDKLVSDLNIFLEEMKRTYPDANWYLEDSGNLNLLSGEICISA